MNTAIATQQQQLWASYRNNLPRHLLGISRYLQSTAMHQLIEQRGHPRLKLAFEPYITLVGSSGCRLTELADALGISKQACNQTANQLQAAGYIERRPDPLDGRARILVLTQYGRQLMHDGAEIASANEAHCRSLVGKPAMASLVACLRRLHSGLGLPQARVSNKDVQGSAYLSALLPRLSDYVMQRLMQQTIAKGHSGLKMSHGQVLTLIGLSGGSIQQMARIQDVSKQAISAIVNDLESLGYLYRESDPYDARQQVILFTPSGIALLGDSVASVGTLNAEFEAILGASVHSQFKNIARQLYQALHLEEDVFGPQTDIKSLATQLKQQLGKQGVDELTRLLQSDLEVSA
jgi:DNA-binding MarR family transcriptional regulator